MIKLHIGQAKFSAIHPIQTAQLSAITDVMGFKSVHIIYVAYSPKHITALRAHTCKHQATVINKKYWEQEQESYWICSVSVSEDDT